MIDDPAMQFVQRIRGKKRTRVYSLRQVWDGGLDFAEDGDGYTNLENYLHALVASDGSLSQR